MNPLTLEQENILSTIVEDSSVQALAVLDLPLDATKSFLAKAKEFVLANYSVLANHVLLVVLNASAASGEELSSNNVQRFIARGEKILEVDSNFRIHSSSEGCVKSISCSKRTRSKPSLAVRIEGSWFIAFLDGLIISEDDFIHPGISEPARSPWSKSMIEFEAILLDHKQACLDREHLIKLWKDKSKRILLQGDEGTEMIFHRSLFWWLGAYVKNKLRIYAEPVGLGQDKTDINIVTVEGTYAIEVKWLGKNEKDTEYKQDRINEGLAQVSIYLVNDPLIVRGFLVMYDGRSDSEHLTQSDFDPAFKHDRCNSPNIFFLDSITPSVAAVQIVKNAKVK